jgi:hypothetical protein
MLRCLAVESLLPTSLSSCARSTAQVDVDESTQMNNTCNDVTEVHLVYSECLTSGRVPTAFSRRVVNVDQRLAMAGTGSLRLENRFGVGASQM